VTVQNDFDVIRYEHGFETVSKIIDGL